MQVAALALAGLPYLLPGDHLSPGPCLIRALLLCPGLETKLQEFSVEERAVLDILTQVNVVRRECEIVSVRSRDPPLRCWLGQGVWPSPWMCSRESPWGLQDSLASRGSLGDVWRRQGCMCYPMQPGSTPDTDCCLDWERLGMGRACQLLSLHRPGSAWGFPANAATPLAETAPQSRAAPRDEPHAWPSCPLCVLFWQKLEASEFDEKKEINKRKQMILEGKVSDPCGGQGWCTMYPQDRRLGSGMAGIWEG